MLPPGKCESDLRWGRFQQVVLQIVSSHSRVRSTLEISDVEPQEGFQIRGEPTEISNAGSEVHPCRPSAFLNKVTTQPESATAVSDGWICLNVRHGAAKK